MKYILLLLLVSSCQMTQLVNLKSNSFSYREKINDEWTTFTEWDTVTTNIQIKKINFLFVKDKITIFEKQPLVFKVIGLPIEKTSQSGKEAILFNCKDDEGLRCHIIMIDQGNNVNLVVYYKNLNLCYNIPESN